MARLHVRREVFSHGVLSADLLNLSDANTQSLAQQLAFTVLSHTSGSTAALKFTSWLQSACDLFRCTDQTARIYFETFLSVHNKNIHKHGAPRLLLSADLGEFLLFLQLQKYRNSVSGTTGAPSLLSPTSSSQSSQAPSKASTPLEFIVNNLNLLLLLIRDPHKQIHDVASLPLSPHSANSPLTPPPRSPPVSVGHGHSHSHSGGNAVSNQHLCLDAHEFNRLGFLFYGHDEVIEQREQSDILRENEKMEVPETRREVLHLATLTPFFHTNASKDSNVSAAPIHQSLPSVPIAIIQEWLLRNLTDMNIPYSRPVLSHSHLLYGPCIKHTRVGGARSETLVLTEPAIEGGDLCLQSLNDCTVSVLTHSRYVLIEDCHNCVIQCGTVGSLCIVRHCSSLTLTLATRSIHIADTKHLRLFLFSSNRPIILGSNNSDIVLAPYNSYYPSLSSDLSLVAVPTSVNCWSSPLLMSHGSGTTASQLLQSPLRGTRTLGGGSGGSFIYHSHSSLSPSGGVPASPPPPSSPRRSSSPSPLLASLSHHQSPPPASSPTSPFRRTVSHPISPNATSPTTLSPSERSHSATSPIASTLTVSDHIQSQPQRAQRSLTVDRGRTRGRSTTHVREVRSSALASTRMSDEDDSGSEYSQSDDESRSNGLSANSRLHARSSSYQSRERESALGGIGGLKLHSQGHGHSHHSSVAHHSSGHSHSHSHADDSHSPNHLSPSNLSPPFGAMHPSQTQPSPMSSTLTLGVNTMSALSPLSPNSHGGSQFSHTLSPSAALANFFPVSPTSASNNGIIALLPPELFFTVIDSSVQRVEGVMMASALFPGHAISVTTGNPFALPSIYAEFLNDRPAHAVKARELIDAANLTDGEHQSLQASLTQGFQSWLKSALTPQQLSQLMRANEAQSVDVAATVAGIKDPAHATAAASPIDQ